MYQVLSPDGFQIMVQGEMNFTSLRKAKQNLSQWIKGFSTRKLVIMGMSVKSHSTSYQTIVR